MRLEDESLSAMLSGIDALHRKDHRSRCEPLVRIYEAESGKPVWQFDDCMDMLASNPDRLEEM